MSGTTLPDDRDLLDAWLSGDQRAGEALFDRHFDSIHRFFASKVAGDVGDLVQRTFLGCLEARGRFRGDAGFRTFLFAIARNELFGYYRAKRRTSAIDFGVSSVADLAGGPSSLVRAHSARAALVDALRRLPVDLQVTVELRFWEGLSGPELAAVLDLPEGTVRSRLRRAVELLRASLPPEFSGSSTLSGLVVHSEDELDAWAEAAMRLR